MKKLIVMLAAGLVAVSAFAQGETPSSTVYTSPSGVASLDILDHLAWGYDIVSSDDFTPQGGGEVDLNILNLKLYPAESFGIEAGLDCKWQFLQTKESYFFLDSNRIPQAYKTLLTDSKGRHQGSLDVFSLSVPVLAKLCVGKFFIGGGAEANFNLVTSTTDLTKNENVRTEVTMSKGKANTFTYDFMGVAGYQSFGVFFKYYPKNSSFVPEGGVKFNYFTVGIALFMK